jgi:hypothetical protein
MASGRYYFPAKPMARFRKLSIRKFAKPLRGVALYDVDADGDLDAYGCCEAGDRLYMQAEPGKFVDRTEALGLGKVAGVSCSFADVDADGKPDLLSGGVVYRGTKGGFARSELLPAAARRDVYSSALVDVNGDGYPDAVVSRRAGGLAVYMNPGSKGGAFTDVTKKLALDQEDQGAGGTGYFEPGDWDGDGRTDFLYAAGEGTLLLQGKDGTFEGVPLSEEEGDFGGMGDGMPGEEPFADDEESSLGAAAFGPLWRHDRSSFLLPVGEQTQLLAYSDGRPEDVTKYGNEIQDPAHGLLMAVAEDFTADGTVDAYVASRFPGQKALYLMNRGYGSFMLSEKYAEWKVVPPEIYNRGAGGLAAGDATGDGANDLLFGGLDGSLVLLVNDALAARKPKERPKYHEAKLLQTRILTVIVRGRTGVIGAAVSLATADKRVVAVRRIGSNVGTGCRGPDATSIAVREPGTYTLAVRFSDGAVLTRTVDLTAKAKAHQVIIADRETAKANLAEAR